MEQYIFLINYYCQEGEHRSRKVIATDEVQAVQEAKRIGSKYGEQVTKVISVTPEMKL